MHTYMFGIKLIKEETLKGAMCSISERTQETEKLVSPFFLFFQFIHSV